MAIAGAMYCHKKASVPAFGVLVAKSPENANYGFKVFAVACAQGNLDLLARHK